MKRLFPILLSLICLFPLTSQAVDVDNLYSASVIANGNQSNRTLQKVAFAEVLVKVSGNSRVASNPVIKKALVSARDYLVKQSETRVEGQRYLQASFNEQKVNRLLRSSQLGVWGKNRPQQVIWLVVDENFNRSVKGESDRQYAAFISAIKRQAETRAIPMLFPVMDLDDQLQVSSSDLWGQFTDPVEQASARYGADNYMIAKIIKNVDDYQLSWSLYGRNSKNQPYEIWLNGKSQGVLDQLGIDLANKVANHLGDRYSVKVSGNNETVFLNIDHVTDIKAYAKLIEMFTAMSAVAQADITAVTGSSVQLKLTLLGTQQDLLKELSLDPRINSVQNAFGDSSFEWVGSN